MTLIPPNVAALIEEARGIFDLYESDHVVHQLCAALEAAYATPAKCPGCGSDDKRYRFGLPCSNPWHGEFLSPPARSLPTVEDVAEVLNQQLIVYSDYGTVAGSSIDSAARAVLALLAREGEAGQ